MSMRCDNDVSEVWQLRKWVIRVESMRYYNDIKGGIKMTSMRHDSDVNKVL